MNLEDVVPKQNALEILGTYYLYISLGTLSVLTAISIIWLAMYWFGYAE